MAADDEKLRVFLQEHVTYERVMLGYALTGLLTTTEQNAWNLYYETFFIHGRNLDEFLRGKGDQNTIAASDYIKKWVKPKAFFTGNELNTFIFHLSQKRVTVPKLKVDKMVAYGVWLDREWAKFCAALPDDYKDLASLTPVCSGLVASSSQFQACTAIQVMTSTLSPAPAPAAFANGTFTLTLKTGDE